MPIVAITIAGYLKARGTLDHSEIAENVKRRRESFCSQQVSDEEYGVEDEEMFEEFVKLLRESVKKVQKSK